MSDTTEWQHPTGKVPENVALVALGPSRADFFECMTQHECPNWDEVWTVNTGLRFVPADVAFIMDDMRWFAQRFPVYGEHMQQARVPILTCVQYPEFPTAREYPLRDVIKWAGMSLFHDNSIPYVLGYAGMIGVKSITLFGVDYSYPNMTRVEAGSQVTAVWVGLLKGRSITVQVTQNSSFLQTNRRTSDPEFRPFYGFLSQPIL